MTQTPASLLQRLRSPTDQAAWVQFLHLYTPLLYYWARRLNLQGADAADLVQEVLLVLVRTLPEFDYDRHRSFRGWMRTVLLNKWRQQRRGANDPAGNGADLDQLPGPDAFADLSDNEYRGYLAGRALELMKAEFAPTTWRACWEFVVQGRPAAEVAAELGLAVGTVYAAKFRVLARLREQLSGLME
jgi:RNA polymerase sigma-70 factor (ECF subfamily)